MKKGDIVVVNDSSYSFVIVNDCLEHHAGEVQKERQIVIAVDCDLPADYNLHSESQRNDVIVKGQTSGKITFIQQRFCRPVPPTHKIIIDVVINRNCSVYGEVIKISDRLYQEIKRDSQTQ